MSKFISKRFLFIFISIIFWSFSSLSVINAQDANQGLESSDTKNFGETETISFSAEVVEILKIQEKTREDGAIFKQQNLKLKGLSGRFKGRDIIFEGISDLEVSNANFYDVGDRVFVDAYIDEYGQEVFYVTEFIRSSPLLLLMFIFAILVLLIGRFKGLKALISLALSFTIIIKFILPQILNGRDPFLVSLLGGFLILILIIYITEGWGRKSHLAIFSVGLSLLTTLILAFVFTKLTKLTGLAQEEAIFLIDFGGATINFQGLLLAGFVIGAIGVLDDIVVGQIEAVNSLKEANPSLPVKKTFSLAYRIGNTHLGAIINTLFLTYAGAALPLLLLFVINREVGLGFERVINTEVISTEIVRTLVGSIGVILSMPIATFLAAISYHKKQNK